MGHDLQGQIDELRTLVRAQAEEIDALRGQSGGLGGPPGSPDLGGGAAVPVAGPDGAAAGFSGRSGNVGWRGDSGDVGRSGDSGDGRGVPSPSPGGALSRRAFGLAIAGAAASVAAVGATVGDAVPAGASEGAPVDLGKDNTGATARTGIFSQTSGLWATLGDPHLGLPGTNDTPAQAGLVGSGFYGVVGYATDEDGVGIMGTDATPNGSAAGGAGTGVSAQIRNPANESPAMVATTQGGGGALWAFSQNERSDAAAVWVTNDGSGASIYATDNGAGTGPLINAEVENASNPSSAIVVSVAGTGYGVDATSSSAALVGTSTAGRGAILTGKLAQVRLVPGTGTHPASGETGDLYLDSSHDLWLCKGGTTWTQVA